AAGASSMSSAVAAHAVADGRGRPPTAASHLLLIPGGGVQVDLEGNMDPVEMGEETIVLLQFLQAGLVGPGGPFDGIVIDGLEDVGVDAAEKRDCLGVPAPPEVVSELLKCLQTLRKVWQNRKCTNDPLRHRFPPVSLVERPASPWTGDQQEPQPG